MLNEADPDVPRAGRPNPSLQWNGRHHRNASKGIELGTVQGNVIVRDCWIQAASTGAIGINKIDRGTAVYDKIVIDGCMLLGNGASGSIGIYCGENEHGLSIMNCTIGNASHPFDNGISGISGAYSPAMVAKFNTIYAMTAAVSLYTGCANAEIGPNFIQHGTPLAISGGGTPPGLRYYFNGMQGTATFSGSTSVNVTLPTMPSATYCVSLGGNAAGYVWVSTKTVTGFTINCSGANSNATDWAVSS